RSDGYSWGIAISWVTLAISEDGWAGAGQVGQIVFASILRLDHRRMYPVPARSAYQYWYMKDLESAKDLAYMPSWPEYIKDTRKYEDRKPSSFGGAWRAIFFLQ